jgi:hypothetical protein
MLLRGRHQEKAVKKTELKIADPPAIMVVLIEDNGDATMSIFQQDEAWSAWCDITIPNETRQALRRALTADCPDEEP